MGAARVFDEIGAIVDERELAQERGRRRMRAADEISSS